MDQGTVIRFITFIAAWLNTAAASKGWYHLPVISEEGVAIVVAFIVSVWTYWKNNNHTKAAAKGQAVIDREKQKAFK